MADRPTITEADRAEIQNRINRSLDYILNGESAYWPDGGRKSVGEIYRNLMDYRLGLPTMDDVDDPADVYRSTLLQLDDQIRDFQKAAPGPHRFRDDHLETQPPDADNPPPSPKDLLNRFNNPISFDGRDISDADVSLEASRTNSLTKGDAAPEIGSPVLRELLRRRRSADGPAPISPRGADLAIPVAQPNELSAPERPLLGPFSGEPMSRRPLPTQVFGLPDKSEAPNDDDWFKFFAGLAR